MIKYIQESAFQYLLLTECSMGDNAMAAHLRRKCCVLQRALPHMTGSPRRHFEIAAVNAPSGGVPEDIPSRHKPLSAWLPSGSTMQTDILIIGCGIAGATAAPRLLTGSAYHSNADG
jgi:hypothetical protein